MSFGRMAIALAVLIAVLGSVHGYVWARARVRDAGWDGPWGRVLGGALVVLALSIPLAFVGMRAFPRALGSPPRLGCLRVDGGPPSTCSC